MVAFFDWGAAAHTMKYRNVFNFRGLTPHATFAGKQEDISGLCSFFLLEWSESWWIDLLQIITLKNHNACLCPEWRNTMDFSCTIESFRTICLHDSNVHSATENWMVDYNDINLTSDQKHIAKCIGTKLPFCQSLLLIREKISHHFALRSTWKFLPF